MNISSTPEVSSAIPTGAYNPADVASIPSPL